jgi:hypothetical protein
MQLYRFIEQLRVAVVDPWHDWRRGAGQDRIRLPLSPLIEFYEDWLRMDDGARTLHNRIQKLEIEASRRRAPREMVAGDVYHGGEADL